MQTKGTYGLTIENIFVGNKEITFFKNASSSSSQEIDASIWLVCEYVCYLKI